MKSLILVLLLTATSSFAQGSKPLIDLAAEHVAAEYLKKKAGASVQENSFDGLLHKVSSYERDWRCEDPPPSSSECVDYACQKLGTFGCDTMDDVKEVSKACLGNYNEKCIRKVCEQLGTFGCDTIDDIKEAGAACRGVRGTKCLDFVCTQLGTFGCDTMDDIKDAGQACKGTDTSCMKSTCSRLGTFGCDTMDDIKEVARACRGED